MSGDISPFLLQILEIVWINILLSGDNAIVIALACRSLPPEQRKWGVLLGSLGAVGLRIAFTLIIVTLLGIPLVKMASGLALLWIATTLVSDDAGESEVAAKTTIWAAVGTIIVADAIMSLDNVVAIAAAANGDPRLIAVGLILSVPLIVFGATIIINVLRWLPWLLWAGAALLGWLGGQLAIEDRVLDSLQIAERPLIGGLAGAAVVLLAAGLLSRRRPNASPAG